MSQSAPLNWGGIKRAYHKGDLTVEDICRRYEVSDGRLYRRIKIENWQLRQPRSSPDARFDKTNLFQRLFRVVDRQMAVLEAKLNEGGDDIDLAANAAARERDARTLGSLVRLLEKLNDLEPEKQQQGQETNTIDTNNEGAAAHLREELANRIHKLLQEEQD